MLIDSHAHMTSETMYPQINEIMQRAQQNGVCKIVNICTDDVTLNRGIELRKNHPWIYNVAATTPHDVEKEGELFFPCVEKAILNNQLIAIGETGLDYFYEHSSRKCQQHFLERYLTLAASSDLPIVFHCRDAFDDLFAICDKIYAGHKALVHCFTGSIEEAKGVLDRDWFLSISGIATFKKSHQLREVIKYTPIDRILIETDSPYLAPQSQRGKMNEPSFIVETARLISDVKNLDHNDTIFTIAKNTDSFFSFSKVD